MFDVHLFAEEPRQCLMEDAWLGWSKFLSRKVLLDPTKRLLVNDRLTLLLEMELYPGAVNSNSTGETGLEHLKSLSIAKNGQLYGSLLESGERSDVVLVLDDGKELKAHKAILSAQSPVFKAMLEAAEGRVLMKGMTFEVATELIKYVYTGKADALEPLAEELLSAAAKVRRNGVSMHYPTVTSFNLQYGLDILKAICGQYLVCKVNTDNAGRLLLLADRLSIVHLKAASLMYIRGHYEEMMLTPDWPLIDNMVKEELRKEKLPQVKESPKEAPESAN